MPSVKGRPATKGGFKKGQSGNPKGRPKGTRNQLSENFIADLYNAWLDHGQDILRRAIKDDPVSTLRVVASVIPKEAKVTHTIVEQLQQMTDEQLELRIRRLIDPEAGTLSANDGESAAAQSKKAL